MTFRGLTGIDTAATKVTGTPGQATLVDTDPIFVSLSLRQRQA